jgi:hypothetical protein
MASSIAAAATTMTIAAMLARRLRVTGHGLAKPSALPRCRL